MTQTELNWSKSENTAKFCVSVSQNERNLNEQPKKDIIPETSRKGVKSKVLAI